MTEHPATNQLVSHWQGLGVVPRPTAGSEGIESLQRRLGVELPDAFRAYLVICDGFAAPRDKDPNGFRFWPSNEIVFVDRFDQGRFASGDTNGLALFGDYLDWSWGYALRLTPEGGPSAVYIVGTASGTPLKVADSFSDFIELYVADDPRLYG